MSDSAFRVTLATPSEQFVDGGGEFNHLFWQVRATLNAVFEHAGVRDEPTAPRLPSQNTFIEHGIKSTVRYLNHFIDLGQKHYCHFVCEYLNVFKARRPHQSSTNRLLIAIWPQHP